MSYATVMVYVDAEYPSRTHVELAAQVANRFRSRLIGVSALLLEAEIMAGGAVATAIVGAEIEQRLSSGGSLLRSVADRSKLNVEWRSFVDPPLSVLLREARAADLVIIQGGSPDGVGRSNVSAGDVVIELGRPALIVPAGIKECRAQHVVVGWKDAREARRAAGDALPFLHEAETVTVVEICEEADKARAQSGVDDVVRFLARHRISARGRVVHPMRGSGADQLIEVAQDVGADLLVTGAYGSSRLGEWILGGMTRDLIKRSPVCCLMSH